MARILCFLLSACTLAGLAVAQRGRPGMGMGPGMMGQGGMPGHDMMGGNSGGGMGPGMMAGGGMGCADGQCPGPVFMSLLQQNTKIQRDYKHTDTGIESLTQSDDPQVAALIKTHVQQMRALLDSCAKGKCSHTPRYFDPLFRAVYSNADKIDMKVGCCDGRGSHRGSVAAACCVLPAGELGLAPLTHLPLLLLLLCTDCGRRSPTLTRVCVWLRTARVTLPSCWCRWAHTHGEAGYPNLSRPLF